MADKEIAVKVQNLTKSFRIPLEASSGIKQKIVNVIKGRKGYREFTPLNDISFEVKKGDFFGIVGKNGSGKSTLLKSIASIYSPDKGAVTVNGTLIPFIELGVGFNPDLSGRENVFLNGALLGFSHAEMEAMYDDIVDFAELNDFMEERLKNYSSGMQVRLAFSIAIRAKGDILLLDEVLAVGDEAFQRKCNNYFKDIKNTKQTVVLVTHDMASVRRYCDRALLLDKGRVVNIGTPDEVANQYTEENIGAQTQSSKRVKGKHPVGLSDRVSEFRIKPVLHNVVNSGEDYVFDIEYTISDDMPVYVAFSVVDLNRTGSIIDTRSKTQAKKGRNKLRYRFPTDIFNDGDFMVTAVLDEEETKNRIAFTNEANTCKFAIRNNEGNKGLLRRNGAWDDE